MGGPVIRPAGPEHVSRIADLVEAAYSPWVARIGMRPGPMEDDYGALVDEGDVYVLCDRPAGGAVLGLLVLRPADDGALMVENVAIDPTRQGEGLGRRLLEFAEAQARERGIGELRLYTHERMTENIELYERLGWTQYERLVSNGFARVFMRKAVSAPEPGVDER